MITDFKLSLNFAKVHLMLYYSRGREMLAGACPAPDCDQ